MKLDTYFPYKLAVAAEAFSRRLVDVYGHDYGLTREEWRMLLLLAEAGSLTSHELSQRTTLDKVQVSRASQRLEKRGLITRAVSKHDRRLRDYACTEAGRAFFDEVYPKVEQQATDLLSALDTRDREALFKGIDALIAVVEGGGARRS